MKKKRSLLLLLFLLFSFVATVQADTATVTNSGRYYFNSATGDYSTNSGKYTCVFKLKINGVNQTAWCSQYNVAAPKSGVTYKSTTMSQKLSLAIGKIVEVVKSKGYNAQRTYTLTYAAINRYLYGVFGASGTVVNDAINQAVYAKYYTSTKLEAGALSIKFASNILSHQSNGTYTGTVNLVANNVYPTESITYKLGKCTNCQIFTDQAMKTPFTSFTLKAGEKNYTKTLYVKANSGVKSGDSVAVSIVGSATSKYTYATQWTRSGSQNLITVSDKSFPHSSTFTAQATIPDLESKAFHFYKLDASGNSLTGANVDVKIEIPTSPVTSKTCSTGGNARCSISFVDEVNYINYSIAEVKAPSGYIISDKIEGKWTIGTNASKCYSHPKGEDSNWTELSDTSDCIARYDLKDVCLDESGKVLPEMQTVEQCKNITTGTEDKENEDIVETASEENGDGTSSGENGDSADSGENDDSTGSEEVPETENKNQWVQKCYDMTTGTIADDNKCNYEYIKVTISGNNFFISMTNNHNYVSFSKRNNNNQDLEGAKLKVCAKAEYDENKLDCTPYETTTGSVLEWESTSAEITYTGFEIGTYYLIEESPAPGYIINDKPVIFSIDEHGKVKLEDSSNGEIAKNSNDEEKIVVIKNNINKIKISKQDLTTAKELPGATINICRAYKNESTNTYNMLVDNEGDCTVATLADGSLATWVSTNKEHEIIGLPAGTYYLVEHIAPKGYSTAESILFTLKKDGTLTDEKGKALANNKLTMYDKKLKEVETGALPIYIVGGTIIGSILVGFGAYYYMLLTKKEVN